MNNSRVSKGEKIKVEPFEPRAEDFSDCVGGEPQANKHNQYPPKFINQALREHAASQQPFIRLSRKENFFRLQKSDLR